MRCINSRISQKDFSYQETCANPARENCDKQEFMKQRSKFKTCQKAMRFEFTTTKKKTSYRLSVGTRKEDSSTGPKTTKPEKYELIQGTISSDCQICSVMNDDRRRCPS